MYQEIARVEETHWWYAGRRFLLGRLLAPLRSPGKPLHILSAGCGTGGELRFLRCYGKVYGIDDHEEAIRSCRASGFGDIVIQASVEHIPFPDKSFDVVCALDLLEHIRDEGPAVAEIHRVLKDEGSAIFTVPAFGWLWSKADEREHHFRRYRRTELRSILIRAGLRPIRETYFNTLFFLPIAAAKIISRLYEPKGLAAAETSLPPALNTWLKRLFLFELRFLSFMDFPFGISILALARKGRS